MNELGYGCKEEILNLEIKLNGKLALVGIFINTCQPQTLGHKSYQTRWLNTVHG